MKTTLARQLLITFVPSMFILLVMAVASVLFQVSIPDMTRDVTTIGDIHPLSGMLSNLGILLWCTSASICGFAAIILYTARSNGTFWFFLFSSILSAYLMFDDFFLFHEDLAPRYLGLDEKFVFVTLGIALFFYAIAFKQFIWQSNYGILLLALGFLVISVTIDVILEPWMQRLGHWSVFFEDGAKWLGIASWCSYYVRTSYQHIVSISRT